MLRNGMGRWRAAGAVALLGLMGLLVGLNGFGPGTAQAKGPLNSPALTDQTPAITVTQMPVQGQNMMTLIYQGGPFRYDKDGVVFGNRERILPAQHRGYYREYTVKTPNERSRGARRIVCGGVKPTAPDACYYTDDHYASFRRIVQ